MASSSPKDPLHHPEDPTAPQRPSSPRFSPETATSLRSAWAPSAACLQPRAWSSIRASSSRPLTRPRGAGTPLTPLTGRHHRRLHPRVGGTLGTLRGSSQRPQRAARLKEVRITRTFSPPHTALPPLKKTLKAPPPVQAIRESTHCLGAQVQARPPPQRAPVSHQTPTLPRAEPCSLHPSIHPLRETWEPLQRPGTHSQVKVNKH